MTLSVIELVSSSTRVTSVKFQKHLSLTLLVSDNQTHRWNQGYLGPKKYCAGEGWLGLEKLNKLTKQGLWHLKVSMNGKKIEQIIKVTLTDRNWNDFVGYWDWIKVF